MLDTLDHLAAAGIATDGAGVDQRAARTPAILETDGKTVGIVDKGPWSLARASSSDQGRWSVPAAAVAS